MRRHGRLDVGTKRVRRSKTDIGALVDLRAHNQVRADAVDGAKRVARLVLAGDPANVGANFQILMDAMVDRAAKLLAVVGERVDGVERVPVAERNAVALKLVVGNIKFAVNAEEEAIVAEDASQVEMRSTDDVEISIKLQDLGAYIDYTSIQATHLDVLILPLALDDRVAFAGISHVD